MAAPAWVAPAIGAAGSLLNKGGSGGKKGGGGASPNMEALLKKFNVILDSSLNLFKTASGTGPDSIKATDERALAQYQKSVLDQTQAALGAYDARAAAAGSPIGQLDTNKDRARTQIASSLESDVANKQYAQTESVLAREAALLPSTSSAAAGFGGAGAVDQANQNQQSAILNAVLNLAGSIPGNAGHTPSNPFSNDIGMPGDAQGPGGFFYRS